MKYYNLSKKNVHEIAEMIFPYAHCIASFDDVFFYHNGSAHNEHKAAVYHYIGNSLDCRYFALENKVYGINNDFTNKTWRRFVKLLVFI